MERKETALLKKIKLMTSRRMNTLLMGEYHSAFRGMGLSFHSVREYGYGDDYRSIDWNVSARMNNLFIKEYVEERELSVMILIDGSASTLFGSSRTKQEAVFETAAMFLYLAQMNGDRICAAVFTDTVEKYIRPRKGGKFILKALDEIVNFVPKSRGTDIAGAIEFARRTLKKRSIVIVISDFLDTGAEVEAAMRHLGKRHDLIPIEVRDPYEGKSKLSGLVEFEELETGRVFLAESVPSIGEADAAYPFEPIRVRTDASVDSAILRYFEKRNRRARRTNGGSRR